MEKQTKRNKFNAPEGVTIVPGILIMAEHFWGRGSTIDDAWKSLQKEKGGTVARLKKQAHLIYSVLHYKSENKDDSVFTYINELGNICYHRDYPPHLIHTKK